MNFEIRETKARACCGFSNSSCKTYEDHPDWPNSKSQRRHIPKGENALFFTMHGAQFCLCRVHAGPFIQSVLENILDIDDAARKLGWKI